MEQDDRHVFFEAGKVIAFIDNVDMDSELTVILLSEEVSHPKDAQFICETTDDDNVKHQLGFFIPKNLAISIASLIRERYHVKD